MAAGLGLIGFVDTFRKAETMSTMAATSKPRHPRPACWPLGTVVQAVLNAKDREPSGEVQICVLSGAEVPDTVRLSQPVVNDLRSNGRVTAFTQGQRYVRLDDLTKARRTSELAARA